MSTKDDRERERLAKNADDLAEAAAGVTKLLGSIRRSRLRSYLAVALSVVALALGGLIETTAVRTSALDRACHLVNDHAVTPLRTVIQEAESSSARNPLPPDLTPGQIAALNQARADTAKLFADAAKAAAPLDCRKLR